MISKLNFIGYFKQALKSDCLRVTFSLYGEKVQFRAENFAIWE